MPLTPAQIKKLDALSLSAHRAFTGASKGEKRSTKRGSSVEFADFRAYYHGDDVRRIDWNAYARFDKLFLKMFLEEEDLDITLLVDGSLSMSFGNPSKIQAASDIAAGIGYIGLVNFDRVSSAIYDTTLRTQMPPQRGKSGVGTLLKFWGQPEATGTVDFANVTRRLALQARRSGLAFVISDFLYADGYETGLKTLAARGFETTVIQLFSREELEPTLYGDLKLVDAEDGSIREISVTDSLLRAYKRNLENYTANLRTFCLKYNMNYILVSNDTPLEVVISRMLRSAGVVK